VYNVFGQQMAEMRKNTNPILDAVEKSLLADTFVQVLFGAIERISTKRQGACRSQALHWT
jgi:hypothetical protein